MINKYLRQEKLKRNKKRRLIRKKSCKDETTNYRRIRLKKFSIAGSIHGARKVKVEIIGGNIFVSDII